VTGALTAPEAPLDLHEGISPDGAPTPAGNGREERSKECVRWPAKLRLLSSHGELVKGRCKATNLCGYCARLAAVENSEVLLLDALEGGDPPTISATLTTRTATRDTARFYKTRELLMADLKAQWPGAKYAAQVEFQKAEVNGERRPHWHFMFKGIPAADVDQARDVIGSRWCGREDAEPAGQKVTNLWAAGGFIRYVALHFQKADQAPPEGWTGHRFLKSHDYLWKPTPEAREEARKSLRFKRALWRALSSGATGLDVELCALRELELAAATTWQLVQEGDGRWWPMTPMTPAERMRLHARARATMKGTP